MRMAARLFLSTRSDDMEDYGDLSFNYPASAPLSTFDLDGNGLDDIVLLGTNRVHAYYNHYDINSLISLGLTSSVIDAKDIKNSKDFNLFIDGSIKSGVTELKNFELKLTHIENNLDELNGTNENDIIYGTNSGDIINGFDGDDIIYGLAGPDNIHGGLGNDNIVEALEMI